MISFRQLAAFQSESEGLRISALADRTKLSRPTALRLICTLERRGLLERVGNQGYRLGIRPLKRKAYCLGYGAHRSEFAFSRDVSDGLVAAAKREGVDLLVLDNRYGPKVAMRNVDTFIREKLDLVIEFQADEQIAAPVISSPLMTAGIPLIAVAIPHPDATYYGANNYAAGLIGGRFAADRDSAGYPRSAPGDRRPSCRAVERQRTVRPEPGGSSILSAA